MFESEVHRHVKDMEHHVVVYEEIVENKRLEKKGERSKEGEGTEVGSSTLQERDDLRDFCEQKRKIATPISIEDLFKPRSSKAAVGRSDIRRVLLYGNPGSGKTCISKAIAHRWALGEMLQEFEAIYMIPIRRVNITKAKGVRGEALREVVASICFDRKGSDAEFEELKTQVNDDLHMSSTLLMLDGLDEADEDARELLHEAEMGECRLLILTRPYNLQGLQKKVDCQFECLGFNDQQLRNYINKELQQDEASRLVRSLHQDRGMWETAHLPVMAHILCSLSREHGIAIEHQRKRASMFQIYGDMANFVWKRFKEKPERGMVNKDMVFGDLEKIAFEALRNGQILIEERIVEEHATSTNTTKIFKESGFLLFVLEGQHYQFPHLTFQEYFAGRFISRSLMIKQSREERQVLQFIQEGKYVQKYDLSIHFAANALARCTEENALHKMLSIINDQPIEVLGVQHFLLKMRVLEAILEGTNQEDLEDFLSNEKATKLAEGARQLLERTIDDVLICEIVIGEFQHFSCILENFPRILNQTIDEVKRLVAHSQQLTWMKMAKITNALKLAKHSSKHSDEMIQFVLKLADKVDSWCDPMEGIRRLESIATHVPQHAGMILSMLASWCDNEDTVVRRAAIEAVGRVVATAPQHAGDVLPTLLNRCSDESWSVCPSAMETIGRVIAAAPQHAGEVLPTLARFCGHEYPDVRQAAMEAIGRVVAAAPQHAGELLPTLESWCSDERGSMVRRAAIEAIANVVAEAPQHAGKFLPMLESWCSDEDSVVRWTAMEGIDRVVSAAPWHADKVLPTFLSWCSDEDSVIRTTGIESIEDVVAQATNYAGDVLPILAKTCDDEDTVVRRDATEAIGRVVAAAPQHAGELLHVLAKRCSEDHRIVRRAAIEAVGRIAAAAPQHAGEILPALAKGCSDEDEDVYRAAIEAVGRVVAAAPRHAGEVLPMLVSWCCDEDSAVRQTAIEAVGRVVAAAPRHAGEVLPMLVSWCCDEDSVVRQTAIEAVGRGAEEAPRQAGEVLSMLGSWCGDESSVVRRAATEAVGRVIEVVPQYAGELLQTLAKNCSDKELSVRNAARTAIKNVKPEKLVHSSISFLPTYKGGILFLFVQNSITVDPFTKSEAVVPLVLHTTSSQEIGKQDRYCIDRYVEFLKQEFEETFPRLLNELGMSELIQPPSRYSQKLKWWKRSRI